jgi:hypothetical protein
MPANKAGIFISAVCIGEINTLNSLTSKKLIELVTTIIDSAFAIEVYLIIQLKQRLINWGSIVEQI